MIGTKAVVIVGGGRQGRNVADALRAASPLEPPAGYLDDTKAPGTLIDDLPVLGGFDRMSDPAFRLRHRWFVALGDNAVRRRIGARLVAEGAEMANAVHPAAIISPHATMGTGIYLSTFVKISSGATIGDLALVEGGSIVGVDARVGRAASLGPNCTLTGGSAVEDEAFLGAGVALSYDVIVGRGSVVGAGAAVVRHVPAGMRAQGVPARVVGPAERGR